MKLQVNDQIFDVDMTPLRERAAAGMRGIIGDKSDPIMRQVVKAAASYAMGKLGIVKQDRNDDPIELVAFHIADMILSEIEKEGVVLTGQLQAGSADGRTGDKALTLSVPPVMVNVTTGEPVISPTANPAPIVQGAATDQPQGGEAVG